MVHRSFFLYYFIQYFSYILKYFHVSSHLKIKFISYLKSFFVIENSIKCHQIIIPFSK